MHWGEGPSSGTQYLHLTKPVQRTTFLNPSMLVVVGGSCRMGTPRQHYRQLDSKSSSHCSMPQLVSTSGVHTASPCCIGPRYGPDLTLLNSLTL